MGTLASFEELFALAESSMSHFSGSIVSIKGLAEACAEVEVLANMLLSGHAATEHERHSVIKWTLWFRQDKVQTILARLGQEDAVFSFPVGGVTGERTKFEHSLTSDSRGRNVRRNTPAKKSTKKPSSPEIRRELRAKRHSSKLHPTGKSAPPQTPERGAETPRKREGLAAQDSFERAYADMLAELRSLRARYKYVDELQAKKLDAERIHVMRRLETFRLKWSGTDRERMSNLEKTSQECRWRRPKKGNGGHLFSGGLPTLSSRGR